MSAASFLLILFSVSLSALAQLLLKTGVGRAAAGAAAGGGRPPLDTMLAYLASPWVLGGLMLYGLGALAWLFVLARLPLSAAYPFVGLGFILTMLIGVGVLGEAVSTGRVAGTLLIALGCVFVARSVA